MRTALVYLTFFTLFIFYCLRFQAHAAPAAPVIKHLSSIIKWTRSTTSNAAKSVGNVVQFENGYLVETIVEGNALGVVPHSIRVSQEGELFAVDAVNSNIVRITPPLSQYSRARLVAGSFQGYIGHVDGKSNDARFSHPKGVTMDDKGNVYVADTSNLAIRKIGESGVTTIAGGKSNVAGYTDGPSEDAKFSSDFDVIYVRPTCSLLVIDRGNAALRQISLNQEDCDYQFSSVSPTDLVLVVGAVLIGYAICMLQQGFGTSYFSRMQPIRSNSKEQHSKEKPFGQLILDLSKLALEALAGAFVYLTPFSIRSKGLTPLKDSLIMPEDEPRPTVVQKQRTPAPMSETRHAHTPNTGDKHSEMKPPKMRSSSFKDPSTLSKHRSSKRQEYAEFYGASGEIPTHVRSKSQKERTKHRQRDKSGEHGFGGTAAEQKPVDMKGANCEDPKYGHYRSKYGDSYRYD